jgi:hypothetical protein
MLVDTFLYKANEGTYQRVFALHVVAWEDLSILVDQCEWSSHFRLSNAFCLVCYPLPRQALLLVCKVGPHATTGCDEEDGGCEVEWLGLLLVPCSSRKDIQSHFWGRNSQEERTPPLFLALIWSIVLSALRDVDCENDRAWTFDPLAACPVLILVLCVSLKHRKVPLVAVRNVVVDFELHEANVRRAMRGAALFSKAFDAPVASLHEADMML